MVHRTGQSAALLAALLLLAGQAAPLAAQQASQSKPERLQIKHVGEGDRVKVEVGDGRGNSVKLVPFPEDYEENQPANQASASAPAARMRVPGGATASRDVQFAAPAADAGAASDPRGEVRRTAAEQPVERMPAAAIEAKSDFQPRFRSPGVRQTQHAEPVEEQQPAARDPLEPRRQFEDVARPQTAAAAEVRAARTASREPAPFDAADGKSVIESAYAKSKHAETEAEYTEIIDLCRQARELGLKPSHEQYAIKLMSWAYNRRGEACVEQGRDGDALTDFEAAAGLNPHSWRTIHNRGVSLAADGRIDEAIADFDRTIELNPRYANAYFNRGELLFMSNYLEEAIADYKRAIELGPEDATMHNSLGHTYYRLERVGEALREYSRAIELDPNFALALINRGDAYVDIGRYGDAAADYRKAIEADPNSARAYQAAAWLMATCPDGHYRDEKLAVEAAQKALALDGNDYRILETLAAAQASAGQFAEAKATQEKAIAAAPREKLVSAEKRMAMYQQDVAYRLVSRQDLIAQHQARQEEEAEKRRFPVMQATAEEPIEDPEQALYPEDTLGFDDSMRQQATPAPKTRGFLPQRFNPFSRARDEPRQQQAPQRNLPKNPSRPRPQQPVRPW